jgi:uncharacterized protein (TIGR03086 family)
MTQDLLDLYDRGSDWATSKVAGATTMLDASTPCDAWSVRTLLNHMLDTQRYFLGAARGKDAPPPSPSPPDVLSNAPSDDFARARADMLSAYGEPGVIEKTGPSLGIAFSDQLLHGWDLATATGQDAAMPDGLPEAAFEMIHGRFTDDQRKGIFKPEIQVPADASAQDKLLAYTGRPLSA